MLLSLSPLAAVLASGTFGVSDFVGGLAGRRTSAPSVAAGIELVGLVVLPLAVLLLPLGWYVYSALLAFGGGAICGLGLIAFYRAMALGLIGVVAPISGFVSATLPVAIGLLTGERLGVWQLAGIAIGLLAIPLLHRVGRERAQVSLSAIVLAVLAGIAFGVFFVLLHAASGAGVTAFVSARLGSCLAVAIAAVASGTPLLIRHSAWRLVAIGGVSGAAGSVFYLYGSRTGLLSVTALLASFYPGFTVLCARFFTRERLTCSQSLGATMAIVAIALIAVPPQMSMTNI